MPFLILLEDEKLCVCSWRIIEAHLGENKFSVISPRQLYHTAEGMRLLSAIISFPSAEAARIPPLSSQTETKKIIHANLRPESNKSFFFFF